MCVKKDHFTSSNLTLLLWQTSHHKMCLSDETDKPPTIEVKVWSTSRVTVGVKNETFGFTQKTSSIVSHNFSISNSPLSVISFNQRTFKAQHAWWYLLRFPTQIIVASFFNLCNFNFPMWFTPQAKQVFISPSPEINGCIKNTIESNVNEHWLIVLFWPARLVWVIFVWSGDGLSHIIHTFIL